MGASLIRRDWGETLDDMAQNFPWQFSGNLQKWVGKWNDLPVDQHMLIALSAPRPVYVNGGLSDQWSDPKGESWRWSRPVRSISSSASKTLARASCRSSTSPLPAATSPSTTTAAATRPSPPTGSCSWISPSGISRAQHSPNCLAHFAICNCHLHLAISSRTAQRRNYD